MRFLSTFSGIEAASVAWEPLGWQACGFAEIEPFCRALLAQRFPGVPNLGDATGFMEWPDLGTVELVCGGTPCQSFSVAGLRKGLADPRGNLALAFLAVVDRYRPRWVVWENVPGVLSSNGGRDFAAFLGGLGQLGYGWCYRVLDAQHVRVDGFPRAVPQRRRRVFVVGCLGDWAAAAAVLSEPESVLGDTPPRRKAGEGTAPTLAGSTGGRGGPGVHADDADSLIPEISNALAARDYKLPRAEDNVGIIAVPVAPPMMAQGNATGGERPYGTYGDSWDSLIAHSLRVDGFDASEDGTGRGTKHMVASSFPDGWTDIAYRGKPATDGPRYKALGNSWAVNVVRWIGRRIAMVEAIRAELEGAA